MSGNLAAMVERYGNRNPSTVQFDWQSVAGTTRSDKVQPAIALLAGTIEPEALNLIVLWHSAIATQSLNG